MSRNGLGDDVRELRLALVCYGGVSLAVYMHGLTKELRKLVVASRAFEASPGTAPAGLADSERVYFDALQALAAAGRPLRVVIDVISGTSAGGINGVCLATALACDGDDGGLRDLWLDRGDLGGLLNAPKPLPLWLRIGIVSQRLASQARSFTPLRGDDMARWLYDALKQIQKPVSVAGGLALVPVDQSLHLRVTATDLLGYERLIESGTGGLPLHDRTYRHVFEFDYQPGALNSFTAADTAALALASRCTSSIPGAFPAVRLGQFKDQLGASRPVDLDRLCASYFGAYTDMTVAATATEFVDGGVLDNAPFDHALDLIAGQRAQTDVARHLIYLEPDPGIAATLRAAPAQSGNESASGWLATAWNAVMKVSRHEPLLAQLLRLRDLNERVSTVGAIADEQMTAVQQLVATKSTDAGIPGALHDLSYEQLSALNSALHTEAATRAELSYPTYVRLKLQDALRRVAFEITSHCGYHQTSSQTTFTRLCLQAWLHSQPAFEKQNDQTNDLLDQLDVGYRDRRLRFVLQGVNALYGDTNAPPRSSINALKAALWDHLELLGNAGHEVVTAMPAGTLAMFGRSALTEAVLEANPPGYAQTHTAELATLMATYGASLKPAVTTTTADLWAQFVTLTRDWTVEHRRAIAVRYVAFPIWDQLLFPIVALSNTPQLTPIRPTRFSPDRATLLKSPKVPGKLRGLAFHHFAAFFHRDWRENDYLWGRLDGAELVLRLLADAGDHALTEPEITKRAGQAFLALLDSENSLTDIAALRTDLRAQATALAEGG